MVIWKSIIFLVVADTESFPLIMPQDGATMSALMYSFAAEESSAKNSTRPLLYICVSTLYCHWGREVGVKACCGLLADSTGMLTAARDNIFGDDWVCCCDLDSEVFLYELVCMTSSLAAAEFLLADTPIICSLS